MILLNKSIFFYFKLTVNVQGSSPHVQRAHGPRTAGDMQSLASWNFVDEWCTDEKSRLARRLFYFMQRSYCAAGGRVMEFASLKLTTVSGASVMSRLLPVIAAPAVPAPAQRERRLQRPCRRPQDRRSRRL